MEAVRKFPGHSRHFIEFIKSEILLQTILLFFRSIFDTLRLRPLLPRPASVHPGAGNRPEVEERIHRSVETGLPVLEGSRQYITCSLDHSLPGRSRPRQWDRGFQCRPLLQHHHRLVSQVLCQGRHDIQTYSQLI